MRDTRPILVGSGQCVVREINSREDIKDPYQLAGQAVHKALVDTQAVLPLNELTGMVDTLAMVRFFNDSNLALRNPFGRASKPPRKVAELSGIDAQSYIYGHVGGNTPQAMVTEMARKIAKGQSELAVVCGAEAMGAIKVAQKRGWKLNWSSKQEGEIEDRGWSWLFDLYETVHGITYPIQVYSLLENAWRAEQGVDANKHKQEMAELLHKLNQAAVNNPYAQFPDALDVEYLSTASETNRPLTDLYNKWSVAQDAVNQSASVVLTSVDKAKQLGIPKSQWVFLHGFADAEEATVVKRQKLHTATTLLPSTQQALAMAEINADKLDLIDIYSCFPVAISAMCQVLNISWKDKDQVVSLTGGMQYFGGPGNNYSTHAIAEMTRQLRARPNSFGLVTANGGYLTKQSIGVYSTQEVKDSARYAQAGETVESATQVEVKKRFWRRAKGTIESYCVLYKKGKPRSAIIVGRTEDNNRFLAKTSPSDINTTKLLESQEAIGRPVSVRSRLFANYFKLSNN